MRHYYKEICDTIYNIINSSLNRNVIIMIYGGVFKGLMFNWVSILSVYYDGYIIIPQASCQNK